MKFLFLIALFALPQGNEYWTKTKYGDCFVDDLTGEVIFCK